MFTTGHGGGVRLARHVIRGTAVFFVSRAFLNGRVWPLVMCIICWYIYVRPISYISKRKTKVTSYVYIIYLICIIYQISYRWRVVFFLLCFFPSAAQDWFITLLWVWIYMVLLVPRMVRGFSQISVLGCDLPGTLGPLMISLGIQS